MCVVKPVCIFRWILIKERKFRLFFLKTYHLLLKTDTKFQHVTPVGQTGLVNFI
jgi:hypothetical protein